VDEAQSFLKNAEMDRIKILKEKKKAELFNELTDLRDTLDSEYLANLNRSLPFADLMFDRWERARKLGFGEGTSVYDSVLIIGDVVVGDYCWIGPSVILDGSGGLEIGNYCTISAGSQIYSHDNIKKTLTSWREKIEHGRIIIGNNVYIGPNSVISRGITIGDMTVVGAFSFVNRDIPSHSITVGQPAKVVGRIVEDKGKITTLYD
jgi:acetyltransferase-like isoleucine patch superfamily enzyme